MQPYQITLIIVAVLVVVVAITLRNIFTRSPSDEQISKIVSSVIDTDQLAANKEPVPSDGEDLMENLVRFFDSSSSRHILHILASSKDKMAYRELTEQLNVILVKKSRTELPEHAVRAIVMNLMGSNLVQLKDGDLILTPAGRKLIAMISAKSD